MKKVFGILSISALLIANLLVFLPTNDSYALSGTQNGIKGTIDGVDTCHCPDDKGSCKCAVANEE